MPAPAADSVQIVGPPLPDTPRVLTPEALAFIADLQRRFGPERQTLLATRRARRSAFREGALPDFIRETISIREGPWRVAPAPADLDDRRVEITGPVERKMMINAFNSGAKVFMGDFEDALSPTWENVIAGQGNCQDAVRRTMTFTAPDGREYRLAERIATLVVRPRGWHLNEKHVLLDGAPVSASLFDFGLYFFHNAAELLRLGSGPYFYLPKLEGHLEARLWNDVFVHAQDALGIPRGTIRATVLIETALAAFEMEEILYELKDHAAGLNAGRWDYIFSMLKNFGHRPEFVLPDRMQVTMTVPFMRAYTELLVRTCHRRGAHAIGGMAAFIPSRKDAVVNAAALMRVTEDKTREAADGFDGSWVAHPDLVGAVLDVFNAKLGSRPNQKDRLREDVHTTRHALLDVGIPGGQVSEWGMRTNIRVALEYIENWLDGRGAVGINNLMEDSATAEICRTQLWQWIRLGADLVDGRQMTSQLFVSLLTEEMGDLRRDFPSPRLEDAALLFSRMILSDTLEEFLTLPAYELIV